MASPKKPLLIVAPFYNEAEAWARDANIAFWKYVPYVSTAERLPPGDYVVTRAPKRGEECAKVKDIEYMLNHRKCTRITHQRARDRYARR